MRSIILSVGTVTLAEPVQMSSRRPIDAAGQLSTKSRELQTMWQVDQGLWNGASAMTTNVTSRHGARKRFSRYLQLRPNRVKCSFQVLVSLWPTQAQPEACRCTVHHWGVWRCRMYV